MKPLMGKARAYQGQGRGLTAHRLDGKGAFLLLVSTCVNLSTCTFQENNQKRESHVSRKGVCSYLEKLAHLSRKTRKARKASLDFLID